MEEDRYRSSTLASQGMTVSDINPPVSNGHSNGHKFSAYPSDHDTAYLQDLAYKAKFAEQISKDMRVPDRIALENSGTVSSNGSPAIPLNHRSLDAEMNVPDKITLTDSSPHTGSDYPYDEEFKENTSPLHRNKSNNKFDEIIELKTPPRALNAFDRHEITPVTTLKRSNSTGEVKNTDQSQFNFQNQGINGNGNSTLEMVKQNSSDMPFWMEDILTEDSTSAMVRQQLQKLHRRLNTLEKKEDDRSGQEKRLQHITYASAVIASISVIGMIIALKRTARYY